MLSTGYYVLALRLLTLAKLGNKLLSAADVDLIILLCLTFQTLIELLVHMDTVRRHVMPVRAERNDKAICLRSAPVGSIKYMMDCHLLAAGNDTMF